MNDDQQLSDQFVQDILSEVQGEEPERDLILREGGEQLWQNKN